MGSLYFKELKGDELDSQLKQSLIKVEDEIHSEKQLGEYLVKIGAEKIENSSIQFRIYFIKNFDKDQSCLIVKSSHGMVHGMGLLLAACGL